MELALIIIGALSTLASTIVGGLNIGAQKKVNSQNINFQQNVNEQNLNEQWKMWEATNEYNNPAAQMERYRSAGLNPNLIYGQSNTTNAANVSSAVAPHSNPVDYSSLNLVLPQLLSFLTQSDNVKRNRYQNKIADEQSEALGIANEVAQALKETNINKGKRELELAEATINKVLQDIKTGKSQKALYDVETLAKQLNYDYDKSLYDNGFPPDIDANERAIAGILAQILEQISNINAADILKHFYGFNKN